MDEARRRLAEAERALIRSLVGGEPAPPGFNAERLDAAAHALGQKRARGVAHAWPMLAHALAGDFPVRFDAYASRTDAPAVGGPLADGLVFVERFLREIPPGTERDYLRARTRFVVRRGGRVRARRAPLLVQLRVSARGLLLILWLRGFPGAVIRLAVPSPR